MKVGILKTYGLLAASAMPLMAVAQLGEQRLPNIVFVLADDMGIGDLNCYFKQENIHTPNSDTLAAHGLQFMQHYSGSTVSAPSRCCLMTGKHTGHSYVRGNKGIDTPQGKFDLALPEQEVTVAQLLKQKGYATMCVGKWGLGGPGTSGSPVNKGFDYFFGYFGQAHAHRYYPEYLYENEQRVSLNGRVYSHWLIMEKGLDFIRKQKKGQPYFAYFAITLPHADMDYPDMRNFTGKYKETPYLNVDGKKGYKTQIEPEATYAAMVTEVDKSVGKIIELLKTRGEWENTVFIFSSDNGAHGEGGHNWDFFDSNGPFRGHKRDLYEGGVRTPFLVSWPRHISGHRKTTHISAFWDFLPTVCDIAGVTVPDDVDGISYLPTLLGKEHEQKRHEYIYFEFYEGGGKQSILKDNWKLVRLNVFKPDKLKEELYYLPDDIGENKNLLDKYPEKASELKNLLKGARAESKVFRWKQPK